MRIAFTARSYGRRHNAAVTAAEVQRLAGKLGSTPSGVARAEAYDGTERHIRERRARGLFGRMRFTMAQPDVSCHPELLLEGARRVVSAALCYYAPEPERPAGHGRLPRYTWHDAYAELRDALDALGRSSARRTACSSTRTSMSTARRRRAPASASTARTRC